MRQIPWFTEKDSGSARHHTMADDLSIRRSPRKEQNPVEQRDRKAKQETALDDLEQARAAKAQALERTNALGETMADTAFPTNAKSPSSPAACKILSTSDTDVTYTDEFMDALIQPFTNVPSRPSKAITGIRVIPPGSHEKPKANISVRAEDIDQSTLPEIDPKDLPLPLDDPRRRYASGVAGLRLTHPGGHPAGGPARSSSNTTTPAAAGEAATSSSQSPRNDTNDDSVRIIWLAKIPPHLRPYIEKNSINSQEQLKETVKRDKSKLIEEMRKTFGNRDEAVKHNAKIQEQINEMTAERDMERRVREKAVQERVERAERKKSTLSDGRGNG